MVMTDREERMKRFTEELTSLCRKHGFTLCSSTHDGLNINDIPKETGRYVLAPEISYIDWHRDPSTDE